MEMLEHLFAVKYKKQDFFPRKNMPNAPRVVISGTPKSGKTSLLLHAALTQNEPFLYIDLADRRVSIERLNASLSAFATEQSLRFVCIDNYNSALALPAVPRIWLTAARQTASQNAPQTARQTPAGFTDHTLFPLDFEEYLSLSKHTDSELCFNDFLLGGCLPEIFMQDEPFRSQKVCELLRLLCPNAQKEAALSFFLAHPAQPLTNHQVYSALKNSVKISKDTLYEWVQTLIDNFIVFRVPKFNAPNAPRKCYPFDHALKNALTFDKSLLKSFETMIALELIKRQKELFYDDGVDLLLPNEETIVLAAPFLTQAAMEAKMQKIGRRARRVEFVTMGFEAECDHGEAMGFWDWALQE